MYQFRADVGDKAPPITGTIRFIGFTRFSEGYWVGVELDKEIGKNDGSVDGVRYFRCPPQYGIFVRACQLKIVETDDENKDKLPEKVDMTNNSNIHPNSLMTNANAAIVSPSSHSLSELQTKLCALLKLKISQSMDLLNQQLEIAEDIEETIKSSKLNSSNSSSLKEKFYEVLTLTGQEIVIGKKFRGRIEELFS